MALTKVRTGGITDDAVTGAKIENNPTIAGNLTVSGSSNVSLGADMWRLNTNTTMTNGVNDLNANWERDDTYNVGVPLGSGMSESSGIFTFGQTGIYYIEFRLNFIVGGSSSIYVGCQIHTTINNSNYSHNSSSWTSNQHGGTNSYMRSQVTTIFDVTDTSNDKVKFKYENAVTNGTLLGDTNQNGSSVFFLRIGNT
tara:strand:+ start:29 stop:619 length:591 start_codon:yes stop_codon:yes gene_type:complete